MAPPSSSSSSSSDNTAFINTELSKSTSIFGLKLGVVIGICVGAAIVLILFLLSLCIWKSPRKSKKQQQSYNSKGRPVGNIDPSPVVSKEIKEIIKPEQQVPEIQIDIGKTEHRVIFSDQQHRASSHASGESRSTNATDSVSGNNAGGGGGGLPEVSHLGWGHWYTLRELELATNGLADENVIGEGGYGIVYRGLLPDNTLVAVKNLLNNS